MIAEAQEGARFARIEVQLEHVVEEQRRTNGVLEDIGDALRLFAVMEAKQHEDRKAIERALKEIESTQQRVSTIENELPVVRMASSWVFKAVIGAMGILGVAALAVVLVGGK